MIKFYLQTKLKINKNNMSFTCIFFTFKQKIIFTDNREISKSSVKHVPTYKHIDSLQYISFNLVFISIHYTTYTLFISNV